MRSTRAFRLNISTTGGLTHTFASAIASTATVVARFYVYFTTRPNVDCALWASFSGGTEKAGVWFQASDNTIRAYSGAGGIAVGSTGVTVSTGQWYRVDVKVVHGATVTSDVQVDRTAVNQATSGSLAANCDAFKIGAFGLSSATTDVYFDDIVVSGTSGDYPIGEGIVAGLYPNGDRTSTGAGGQHAYNATTDFGKGSGGATAVAASTAESTSWQSLANPLSTSVATNFISDLLGASAEHMVWTHTAMPPATVINGVMQVVATHSASATSNNSSAGLIRADNGVSVMFANLDLSESTITVPVFVHTTGPGGSAWTVDEVNGSFFYWGDSSDVNPDPYLDGVCLEVDYVPAALLPHRSPYKQLLAH